MTECYVNATLVRWKQLTQLGNLFEVSSSVQFYHAAVITFILSFSRFLTRGMFSWLINDTFISNGIEEIESSLDTDKERCTLHSYLLWGF